MGTPPIGLSYVLIAHRNMSASVLRYPVLQIRPNSLLVYERSEWHGSGSRKNKSRQARANEPQLAFMQVSNPKTAADNNFDENRKTAYSGHMSPGAKKRLKRAINTIIAQATLKTFINPTTGNEVKFRCNFVTLTIPCPQGAITDKQIKKDCLDVWLKYARRVFKLKSYVWRAERQKNGNLHFHLITDVYIPYDQLRDSWNDRLERLNLITEFEKKHGHRHPNSTDVHSIFKINDLAAYMIKYMSKGGLSPMDVSIINGLKFPAGSSPHRKASKRLQECLSLADEPLGGKIWDCSANLKSVKPAEVFLETESLDIWMTEKQRDDVWIKEETTFSMIVYKPWQFKEVLRGPLKVSYNAWIEQVRNYEKPNFTTKQKKDANQLQTLSTGLENSHSSGNQSQVTRKMRALQSGKLLSSLFDEDCPF